MRTFLLLSVAVGFVAGNPFLRVHPHPIFAELIQAQQDASRAGVKNLREFVRTFRPNTVQLGTCNQPLYQQCGTAYAKNLGFQNGAMPADPQVFINRITTIMTTQGVQGFMMICRAGYNLLTCMGGLGPYSACVNIPSLVNLGLSVQAATIYVSVASQLGFECGPGYSTSNQCICTVHWKACGFRYTNQYAQCYKTPFGNSCGGIVGSVVCSSMKAAFKVSMPACMIQCSTSFAERSQLKKLSGIPGRKWTDESSLVACNQLKFQQCSSAYAKALGFTSGNLPADPMQFLAQINYLMFTNHQKGFMTVCRAGGNLLTCMGGQTPYAACISVPNLVNQGLSFQAASLYVFLAYQFTYECGPGYQGILNNYNCLISTSVQQNSTLQACINAYMNGLKNNPSQWCPLTYTYTQCYRAPFNDACGSYAGYLVCASMRAGFIATQNSQCPITCGFPSFFDAVTLPQRAITVIGLPSQSKKPKFSPEAIDCDEAVFEKCVEAFDKTLGIEYLEKDPRVFIEELNQYLMGGQPKQRFTTFCSTYHELIKCVGPMAESCFSVANLMRLGLTHTAALTYIGFDKQFKYECGTAFQVFVDHIECIASTAKTQKPYLDQCLDTFLKKAKEDPSKICRYSQTYLTCWVSPFQKACKQEAGHVLCETIIIGLSESLPQCHYTCPQEIAD